MNSRTNQIHEATFVCLTSSVITLVPLALPAMTQMLVCLVTRMGYSALMIVQPGVIARQGSTHPGQQTTVSHFLPSSHSLVYLHALPAISLIQHTASRATKALNCQTEHQEHVSVRWATVPNLILDSVSSYAKSPASHVCYRTLSYVHHAQKDTNYLIPSSHQPVCQIVLKTVANVMGILLEHVAYAVQDT